jgi:hypothetical protein
LAGGYFSSAWARPCVLWQAQQEAEGELEEAEPEVLPT